MRRTASAALACCLAGLSAASAQTPTILPETPATIATPCVGCASNANLPANAWDGKAASRFWLRGEHLLWWTKDGNTAPLASTGPGGGFPFGPAGSVGAIGTPGTVILNDGGRLSDNPLSGARFTAGTTLDNGLGVDASYFFLGRQTRTDTYDSNTYPVLTRPIFNTFDGINDAEFIAFPGLSTGSLKVSSSSRLQGIDANVSKCVSRSCNSYIDGLAGFRWLNLDERITINESLQLTNNPLLGNLAGSQIGVRDSFSTRNDFYGGQVGLRAGTTQGRFTFDGAFKVALGVSHEEVRIDGSTVITRPGAAPISAAGGLLALPSNSGNFDRDRFAVVPEVTLNVGYHITENVKAFVGYNFLYWSAVARPGDQIDPRVNITQVPTNILTGGTALGAPSPLPAIRQNDFWAQGINFGVQFTY